jgi:hypothetical protein
MEVWDTQNGDIIMLGSKTPWESSPAQFQKIFSRPQASKDLYDLGITSGVSLWTRQVASQKTAAVIAGDGPEQSDEFPILEYDAPKAFFIAKESEKLHFFDERTLQFPLSDKTKIAALRALPEDALLSSFKYRSSNHDVALYIEGLWLKEKGGMQRVDPMGHIVFRDPELYPETPRVASDATPELEECLKLEAQILRSNENWREPGRRIEQILVALIQQNNLTPKDFTPAYYAAFLARFAIGDGDYAAALRLLQLGAVFSYEYEQIQFLSRVVDRIVPPEILEQLRKSDRVVQARF